MTNVHPAFDAALAQVEPPPAGVSLMTVDEYLNRPKEADPVLTNAREIERIAIKIGRQQMAMEVMRWLDRSIYGLNSDNVSELRELCRREAT